MVLKVLKIDVIEWYRFLTMLEEEVYGANSPIWDIEFAQNAVHGSATNGASMYRDFQKTFWISFDYDRS